MLARLASFALTIVVCLGVLVENRAEERKAGKPQEVSILFTVSNSLGYDLDVELNYQIKKTGPLTNVKVGKVPAGTTKKFHERVVYNGLIGPNGKDGNISIFKSGVDEQELAAYNFYVDNTQASHNAKGNQVNSLTEQIDIALLESPDFFYVISVNPKHK
jgi:hypothetical protein